MNEIVSLHNQIISVKNKICQLELYFTIHEIIMKLGKKLKSIRNSII